MNYKVQNACASDKILIRQHTLFKRYKVTCRFYLKPQMSPSASCYPEEIRHGFLYPGDLLLIIRDPE